MRETSVPLDSPHPTRDLRQWRRIDYAARRRQRGRRGAWVVGRIAATVEIRNVAAPDFAKKLDALVDTGASHITLPMAWKEPFRSFQAEQEIELATATQETVQGVVCGPARIQVEGFRVVHGEVLFIDMAAVDGQYEPLLGYIALEQSDAAVDLIGHRLLPARYMDLKALAWQADALDGKHDAAPPWNRAMSIIPPRKSEAEVQPSSNPLVAASGHCVALLDIGREADEGHEYLGLAGDVPAQIPGVAGRVEGGVGDRVDVLHPGVLGFRAGLDGG